MVQVTLKDARDKTIGSMSALEKTFSSGSRGFFAQGKLPIEGKNYQVQVQLVEIGSKPQSSKKSK